MDINEFAQKIYQQNKEVGWWDDKNRCLFQTLQLVSTEVAEATEGERKDLMDDHLPNRKMGEVELADALVRVLDFGAHVGFFYRKSDNYPHSFVHEGASIGKQHLGINMTLFDLVGAWSGIDRRSAFDMEDRYSRLINTILECGRINNYDVMGAALEKLAYNKTRADHQRDNRQAANGKKF